MNYLINFLFSLTLLSGPPLQGHSGPEVIKVYHTSPGLTYRLPQQLETTSNWLLSYRDVLGKDVSSTWLNEQMGAGNLMLLGSEEQQFHLLIESEANSQKALVEELEAGFWGRAHDALFLFGELTWLDGQRITGVFKGALGGKAVFVHTEAFYSPMGSLILMTVTPQHLISQPAQFVPTVTMISANY